MKLINYLKKEIKLTKGAVAIVDDEDFEELNKWKWGLSTSGYAMRQIPGGRIWMQRLLNKTPEGLITDHINRNKLDNRKCNLRNADKRINSINRDKPCNNKSGYKGVYFDTWSKSWRAEVRVMGKKITLGRFEDIQDAVNARLEGEQKYYIFNNIYL